MITWFREAVKKNRTSLCLLKMGNRVFYQNSVCKKLCGNFSGKDCPQTCVLTCQKKLGRALGEDGIQFFPNNKVGNRFFDVLFFNALPYRLVMLYPLQRKYDAWLQRFRNRDLSRRESEIAQLCVQGLTNSKITGKLLISKATLKTHLNNIYKKMPEARSESWREYSAS
jgi:hypothetical protein